MSSPQFTVSNPSGRGGAVPCMEHIDVDPTEHPDYLTLSEAGKECGVGMRVLQKLVRDRKIVEGVARTKRGTPYLHRDHVPSWSQIEAILAQMYLSSSPGSRRP